MRHAISASRRPQRASSDVSRQTARVVLRLLQGCLLVCALPPTLALAAEKVEVKLLVAPGNLVAAKQALEKLAKGTAYAEQVVFFFDTADGALSRRGVILRAREVMGSPGESTVKLRGAGDAPGFDVPAETDVMAPGKSVESRSLDDESIPAGRIAAMANGKVIALKEIFSDRQREFAQVGAGSDFPIDWTALHRYGPAHAKVWKKTLEIGDFKKVTAESWLLARANAEPLELLEVSVKVKGDSEKEIASAAGRFFEAAKPDFGAPSGESKTQKVLDYYKPGN